MFVRPNVKHGNIDPSRLLNDRNQITQRLHTQPVIPTEARGSIASLGFSVHVRPPQIVAGIACSFR